MRRVTLYGKYSFYPRRACALLLALPLVSLPHPLPVPAQPPPLTFAAPPVGQFLRVHGPVWIAKGGKTDAAQSLDAVREGERITVGAGGTAVLVWYATGTRLALGSGCVGKIAGMRWTPVSGPAPRPLPTVSRRLIPPVKPNRRFGPNHGGFIVRVDAPGTKAAAVPGVFIRSPWGAVRDANTITVLWSTSRSRVTLPATVEMTAQDAAAPKSKPVTVKRTLKGTQWSQTGTSASRLAPGMIGEVTVTVGDATDRVPFRILTRAEREQVDAAEQEAALARAAAPTDPMPDTLLAQQYDALELYADALAAYQRALKLAVDDKGLQAIVARLEQGTMP